MVPFQPREQTARGLVFSSAHEVAAAIRDRRVSAVEVVNAYLARIARRSTPSSHSTKRGPWPERAKPMPPWPAASFGGRSTACP